MTNPRVSKPIPPRWRLGISAVVVLVGVVFLFLGLLERNWVEAGLAALIAVSQIPPLMVASKQLRQARVSVVSADAADQ